MRHPVVLDAKPSFYEAGSMEQLTKPNVGVYTNPQHDLWVAPAEPSWEQVQKGTPLKEGEVIVAIKSTGICGLVLNTMNFFLVSSTCLLNVSWATATNHTSRQIVI